MNRTSSPPPVSTGAFPSVSRLLRLLPVALLFCCVQRAQAQFYGVGANLAELSTGTFNAEVSVATGSKWSLHLPVRYNPWTLGGNRKLKQLTVQPGARYWFDQSYGYGWFVGMNALVSRFNAGGLFGHAYRYDGMAYGAALSGGFSLPLSRFWNVEFELGGGGVYSNHAKYECERCGEKIKDEKGVYFVPTKVSVSLVYLF